MHVVQLLLGHGGGRVHHQILCILVHGEGDDLPDGLLSGQQHNQTIHTGRRAGVRGRTVGKGIVHGGELGLDIVFAQTNHLKGLDHDLRVVVPDGAGGGLIAIDHQVILIRFDGQQLLHVALGIHQRLHPALGHGEGVVAEFQLSGLLTDFVHGEVHDPAQGVLLLIEVAGNPFAQHGADHAGGLLSGGFPAGGHADKGAGLQIQLLDKCCLAIRQELGDTAGQIAGFVHLDPAGFAAGLNFHVSQQLVDPLSGLGEVVHGNRFDRGTLEGAEAAALHHLGHVLNFQVNAQVRLVGAVALHGLVVGDVAEGSGGNALVLAEFLKYGHQHILQRAQHVGLSGEGHLHVQLIEFAGGTVGTGVLIPEAGGNLEIAVKAGGHQQLLELLGRLGQGVELAGMVPGGHQIVPGAFRGGGGQNGGGDLQKALLSHQPPQLSHHLAAQNNVALDCGIAQIQIAVLEPHVLVRVPAFIDFKGKLGVTALAQHLDFFGNDLNFTGGQLGILALPLPHHAGHGDGGFFIDRFDHLHHVLGFHDHLSGAVEIPNHEKSKI